MARERAQGGGCVTGLSLHDNDGSPVSAVGSRDEAPVLFASHGSAEAATRTVKPSVSVEPINSNCSPVSSSQRS